MGLSGGVETTQKQQKTSVHRLRLPLLAPEALWWARAQAIPRVNCGTHQPGAATRVNGSETQLVQNLVSINYGG